MKVLAGDIGGTHARLALIEIENGKARVVSARSTPSQEADGLAPLVTRFLDGIRDRPGAACFGVAGPVSNGSVHTTHLPWTIDSRILAREIGISSTLLINDFIAVGEGLPLLQEGDYEVLQKGDPVPMGTLALIGAGTGLGQGFLLPEEGRYRVHASEGGHATLASRTEREWRVYRALEARHGPVSWERVLSGPGLVEVYQCLAGTSTAEDPAAIAARGLDGSDDHAVEALDIFAAVFGAQAGNLALTVLATGGVILAGGIAPKLLAKLRDGTFLRAFRDKGPLEPLLARIPVRVIMNPDVGLLGAAAVASRGTT